MCIKLYVGNISYQSREDDLRATSVEMADEKAAWNVISTLDGTELDGRAIRVSEANPRNDNRRERRW
jgi:RNA recognition motif-containing protein